MKKTIFVNPIPSPKEFSNAATLASLSFGDCCLTDLPALDELLSALYEGSLESPPWTSFLQKMQAAMNASHVTLMLRPPSPESKGVMINTDAASPQATEMYESRFFALDPFVRLTEGDVLTAEELSGKTTWLSSPIYLEYLKPLNIRHLLGADIYTKQGVECRLRITRGHDAEGFSHADKTLVRFLLPHLKRSIRLHAQLDTLECDRQLFAGTVNRMLLGMVSFAHDGSILTMNQEAQRILAQKDGILHTNSGISLERNQENRELQRLLRQALSGGNDTDGPTVVEAMSVTRPSGQSKLGIVVRAIPMGQWSESRRRAAAVLYLRDPTSNSIQPSQEIVRRLFGLTKMEAALAILLAEGLTLDEAAEKLNVMRNTARTHLRSIFCKTGVTRQTMLVRLLLNSVVSLG